MLPGIANAAWIYGGYMEVGRVKLNQLMTMTEGQHIEFPGIEMGHSTIFTGRITWKIHIVVHGEYWIANNSIYILWIVVMDTVFVIVMCTAVRIKDKTMLCHIYFGITLLLYKQCQRPIGQLVAFHRDSQFVTILNILGRTLVGGLNPSDK